MNHLVAYRGDVAIGAIYQDIPAAQDQATNQFNTRYVFQEDRRVIAAYGQGGLFDAMRMTTPMWRMISFPEITPFAVVAAPPLVTPYMWLGANGPSVLMNDEMGVQVSNLTAGILTATVGIWVEVNPRPAPGGMITPIRCTGAIVAAAGVWTNGVLTFTQQLPAGKYAVVGMFAVGANLIFARLIFPNQPTRPGCLGFVSKANPYLPMQRFGVMGLWGEFHTYAPPQLEVFASGATATQEIVLDIVRIGT
jgi:hypothetical protein